MRIVATSDLHGNLPDLPPGDLAIIAGDITPLDILDARQQLDWIERYFYPWAENLPVEHVVFIAGNHDFALQEYSMPKNNKIFYLQDSGVAINNTFVWGTPWVSNLDRWAFSAPGDDLEKIYAQIPEKTDIIISHSPPRGILDCVSGQHVGVPHLASKMQRTQAELLVCGHIHEEFFAVQQGDALFVNASFVDPLYNPRHKAFLIEEGRCRVKIT